jgi:hypothetical protein
LGLTADLKMRYVSDIHLVSEMIPEKLIFGHLSMYQNLTSSYDLGKYKIL